MVNKDEYIEELENVIVGFQEDISSKISEVDAIEAQCSIASSMIDDILSSVESAHDKTRDIKKDDIPDSVYYKLDDIESNLSNAISELSNVSKQIEAIEEQVNNIVYYDRHPSTSEVIKPS